LAYKKMKLGIVIPAYNEEKRIGNTLKEYTQFLKKEVKKNNFEYQILVVINNTKDRTEEVVRKAMKNNKRVSFIRFVKGGKGFAITEGFKYFLEKDFDLIGFVDSDLSTGPKTYYEQALSIREYDGVIASRYIAGSIVSPKQSFQRILASRVFNFLVRSMFFMHFRDTQCGAKIFKKEALQKIIFSLNETQWAFDIDLLYLCQKNNLNIVEFPTVWSDSDGSKLNLKKASTQMFFSIIQLRILNSPFKRIFFMLKPVAGFFWHLIK